MSEAEPLVVPDSLAAGVVEARKKCRDVMPKIIDRLIHIASVSEGRQAGVGVSACKVLAQIAGALKEDKAEKDGQDDALQKAVKTELSKLSPDVKRVMASGLRKVV